MPSNKIIKINVATQQLQLWQANECIFERAISTAKNGVGEKSGSECTPRGEHVIRAMIGAGCAENTVFVGRRATGEIYSSALREEHPQRDWILTRILWLSGTKKGHNRLGDVDTMRRYIYIHGCPAEDVMGEPNSHGCIKMRNEDVISLFNLVELGSRVLITEE